MLDEQLKWNEHIDIVCTKVNKHLGLLSRIRSCLTLKASRCVYNCLIQPIFSYTDSAWGKLSAGCSSNLQWLQNRAAHIILQCDTYRKAFDILDLGRSSYK